MVDRTRSFSLAEFLRAHRDEIVRAWEAEAQKLRPARHLEGPALRDHVPVLLDRLAEVVERAWDADVPRRALGGTPRTHADERLGAGYDLEEVVAEYALLRRCVHEVLDAHGEAAAPADLAALNAGLDQAVSDAVQRFTEVRQRTLTALDKVSAAAIEHGDIAAFLPQLLRVLIDSTESVDTAALLLREGDLLHLRAAVGIEEEVAAGFSLRVGEGFSGGIAARGLPDLLRDASGDPRVRSPALKRHGVRALYGVPLFREGRVIGVAHIGSTRALEFSPGDVQLFHAMVQRAAALIEQQLARDALQRAHERLEVIAEASRVLSSSLDVDVLVTRLVRVVVPRVADWCAVDLVDEVGLLRRRGLLHADPARTQLGLLLDERYAARRSDAGRGPARAVRRGEVELLQEVRDDDLVSMAHDPEHLEALRSFGLQSLLSAPLRAGDGRVVGALTLITDVSSRLLGDGDVPLAEDLASRLGLAIDNARLFARTREDERLLRQLADVVPAMVWMCAPDGQTVLLNRRWFEYTGMTREQSAGWGWLEAVHPDDRPRVEASWTAALESQNREVYELEARFRRADGAYRWHLVRGEPTHDARGRVERWIGADVDIEDRRQAEDERARLLRDLEDAVRARDDLAAAVTHDIRSPLQSILLHADAMARTLPVELVRDRQRIETMRTAAQRVARLTEDLLSLVTIESKRLELDLRREDACAVLAEAVEIAEPIAAARGLTLRLAAACEAGAEPPGDVRCDRDQVARVLENLLGNAIKFTPPGGEVVTRVVRGRDHVRFEVRDTGVGVPRDLQARIFERGVRVGPDGAAGLGLGLTIARAIVHAHGGAIGVEDAPGRGSVFWFTLPAAP